MMDVKELIVIWNYWKSRHTHTWNMFCIALREVETKTPADGTEIEYAWENYIIRLWLYRTAVKTLQHLHPIKNQASKALKEFDETFTVDGDNHLKALRDMLEHFDDYASGKGRGPASREHDLDPWRSFSSDEYKRGRFQMDRHSSLRAANKLRIDAKDTSDSFIRWYHEHKLESLK